MCTFIVELNGDIFRCVFRKLFKNSYLKELAMRSRADYVKISRSLTLSGIKGEHSIKPQPDKRFNRSVSVMSERNRKQSFAVLDDIFRLIFYKTASLLKKKQQKTPLSLITQGRLMCLIYTRRQVYRTSRDDSPRDSSTQ